MEICVNLMLLSLIDSLQKGIPDKLSTIVLVGVTLPVGNNHLQ